MALVTGGQASASGSKIYLNKPAANITRAATTVGAFSTAWQIPGVVVAVGQNVKLTVLAVASNGTNNDYLIALLRGATQVASRIYQSNNTSGLTTLGISFGWIDEAPTASTYTYEVQAAQFTAGTLTVNQTNITTDVVGGTSIFIAEVYTP